MSREVSVDYLKTLESDKSVLLIDVREPEELAASGTIPGSINIPLSTLGGVLKDSTEEDFKATYNREKPNHDTPLVFSCRSGKRSEAALNLALGLGYINSKHYPGGWMGWEQSLKGEN